MEMSDYLGVPVRVDRVDLEWPKRLVLQDVYLEDQVGEVLFEAKHISAGMELLPLLKRKFVFNTVRLFGFNLNLKKETPQDELNLQFVIDAFKKDSTENPLIDLKLSSVLIRKGNVKFDVLSENRTPGKFNPKHLDLKDISSTISLKALTKDSLNVQIKRFGVNEASGLELKNLTISVIANKDSAFVKNFKIKLPGTDFKIDEATMCLTDIEDFDALINRAPVKLKIAPSSIRPSDLKVFVPTFSNFKEHINLIAEAQGYINSIDLQSLTLRYSNKMQFTGSMELKGITRPEDAYIFGRVSKMQITPDGINGIINNFSEFPKELPNAVRSLGTVHFNGEISGFLNNLIAYGNFTSDIGSIKTDLNFGSDKEKNIGTFLRGHISSSDLDISKLALEGNPFGNARFDITMDAVRPVNGKFSGIMDANIEEFDYQGYKYENILLSGKMREDGFNGTVIIDDVNGKLNAEGVFINSKENSVFNFTADVRNFRPDKLNLTSKYEEPNISFSIKADFTGNNIDNINGEINVDSLSITTIPNSFFLDKLLISATGESSSRNLKISSDIINGEVVGAYSFETIVPSFMKTIDPYLPALIKSSGKKAQATMENNFSLLMTIENTEALSNTLKLPIAILSQARITGQYNNKYNKFRMETYLPKFNLGSSMFDSGIITCDNSANDAMFNLKVVHYNKSGVRNYIDVKSTAQSNNINTIFKWSNNKKEVFGSEIHFATSFSEEKDEDGKNFLRTSIDLNPQFLAINDNSWDIEPATIDIERGAISLDRFYASRDNEYIVLHGIISDNPADALFAELNDIGLEYIFNTVNIKALAFGGKATGTVNIRDLYNSKMLDTDLEIKDFSFNDVVLGQLNLFSEWDDGEQGIMMLGSIYKNDSTFTDVSGYIYPVGQKSGLSLFFDANDLDLSFLTPFMDNITSEVKGQGFGAAHLHGSFSTLTVSGDAFIKNGSMKVDFLNTHYFFNDSIHLTDTSIIAKNITVYDIKGNKGILNVDVGHRSFKDIKYDVDVQTNNMLVYDVTERHNPMIYGTVYGTGNANIYGNGKVVNLDINMRNAPNTNMTLNFMSGERANEYDFISFVDKKKIREQEDLGDKTVSNGDSILNALYDKSEIRMNFLLDITPDANIEMVMDPVADDRIKAYGSGSLQIQYGTKSDLRMYGGVNIHDGVYNFSLQQLIRKDFRIREGSTVDFRGDPYEAVMNIDAVYNLTANIADLSQSFAIESPKINIPVNCILFIDGPLRNPMISFDLELPNSNAEVERQVLSLINTEGSMTTQIVYLLVLNKFYTSEMTGGYSSSNFGAVATSALSAQLSSILSSITDKVQIGMNIRSNSHQGLSDTEVEMLLSSQLLDNRLIFNGNFGSRNNPLLNQQNTFIGEFELEYKLTRSGDIRLKAYNQANDMYQYLKTAPYTQGVGVMYRRDFTNFVEVFRRRRRLSSPFTDNIGVTPAENNIKSEEKVSE
jgi:Family of unknown function (DUF490).